MTIQELTEISFSFTNIRYLKPQTNSKPKNDYIFLEGAENIFFSLIIFHFNLHNKMSDGWCSIFPSNEMQHIREITLTSHSLTNQRPVFLLPLTHWCKISADLVIRLALSPWMNFLWSPKPWDILTISDNRHDDCLSDNIIKWLKWDT